MVIHVVSYADSESPLEGGPLFATNDIELAISFVEDVVEQHKVTAGHDVEVNEDGAYHEDGDEWYSWSIDRLTLNKK